MAAFALGLLGDRRARDSLVRALADSSLLVQGSAAEALGLIGDPAAAESIGNVVLDSVENRKTAPGLNPDELVQCMSFLSDVFFRPKAHQNQLAVLCGVDHSSEIFVFQRVAFNVCYIPFHIVRLRRQLNVAKI